MKTKQNLIFKISIASLISGVLVCLSLLTNLIKINEAVVVQFSDGVFMAFVGIISGYIMLIPAVIYPLIVDLFAGALIYIPISIFVRIAMFFVIKFGSKILTFYGAIILASLIMFIYLPFTFLIFQNVGLLISEIIVDSIQVVVSIIIGITIYLPIKRSPSLMKLFNNSTLLYSKTSWLFSDFDGTASLGLDSNLDLESQSFINENFCQKKANKFVFATGRLYNFISEKNNQLLEKPSFTICGNGALIYSQKGKIIHYEAIPENLRPELVDFLKQYKKFPLEVAINGEKLTLHHAYNKNLEEKRRQNLAIFEDYYDKVEPLIYQNKNVTVFYLYMEKGHQKIAQEINDKFQNLHAFQTSPYIVEIVKKNVSKWSAIQWIMNKKNIAPDKIFTCGDGENDYEMLKNAINSAKMAKSSPVLKELEIPIINKISEIKELTPIFEKN